MAKSRNRRAGAKRSKGPPVPRKKPAGRIPSAHEQKLARAVSLHQRGKANEAGALYVEILNADPDNPGALHRFGVLHTDVGRPEQAVELIGEALRHQPGNPIFRCDLGNALQGLGRHEEAIDCYRAVLEAEPRNLTALTNLGLASHNLGRAEEARGATRRALEIDPDNIVALGNLGQALQEDEQPGRAVEAFERLLKVEPGHVNTLAYLAIALQRMIEDIVADYIATRLMVAGSRYRGRAPRNWRLTSWAVVLKSGGHQSPHNHPMGVVSGVYYLNVPDSVGRDDDGLAGCLRFGQSNLRIKGKRGQAGFLARNITPREGTMVLFPSYFWHHTIPFESKDHRICVAFDAIPT